MSDTEIATGPAMAPEDPESPMTAWSDARLVRECLAGNEDAWSALIDKYKRLIFSIPIKYGASRDEAADIFQSVCLEMFSELSKLRKIESVRSWIISVTVHKAFHWKRQLRPQDLELDASDQEAAEQHGLAAPEFLQQVEQEQMVRDAIARIGGRCAEMIKLLFYEHPPPPYTEVAQRLGLATGSIGFIRGRCLKRLQKELDGLDTGVRVSSSHMLPVLMSSSPRMVVTRSAIEVSSPQPRFSSSPSRPSSSASATACPCGPTRSWRTSRSASSSASRS